jgi:hypothetical protein
MSLGKNIRSILGHQRFIRDMKLVKRERESVSFDEASNIGILYNATDERDSEIVKNYMKNIRSVFKKDVLALGFVDKKTMHSSQYAQLSLDFFSRKDLNFMMIPANPTVTNFINTKFDILININARKCLPLSYIAAVSRARFKVGRFTENNPEYFDMLVKIKDEPSIKTVLEEIEHFLRIIRKHESK